jgi:hypothetical protein
VQSADDATGHRTSHHYLLQMGGAVIPLPPDPSLRAKSLVGYHLIGPIAERAGQCAEDHAAGP